MIITLTRKAILEMRAEALEALSRLGEHDAEWEADPFLSLLPAIDPSLHLPEIKLANERLAEMDRLGVDSLEVEA